MCKYVFTTCSLFVQLLLLIVMLSFLLRLPMIFLSLQMTSTLQAFVFVDNDDGDVVCVGFIVTVDVVVVGFITVVVVVVVAAAAITH